MATRGSSGSKRGRGSLSLADEDRRYLNESLKEARGRGAASEGESEGVLFEALERFGLSSARVERLRGAINKMDVRESVDKAQEYLSEQIENARDYARQNPGKVIGGAAGVLVGASLLAIALRRAGAEERPRTSAKTAATSRGKKSPSKKRRS
ncbi:MAG TPA: hypothetical protein VGS96_02820 [Thermoanaerobaculia bacterium]|jgi:hypothetical protein|nr:hypothetical protein [Thermoanaerobaculia bacterium]